MDERERRPTSYMKKLRGLPGLARMAKFSFSAGEVMIGRVGANLKGIDLADGARGAAAGADRAARSRTWASRPAAQRPQLGRRGAEEGDAGGAGRIILGAELARKLRAKVGDCVSVLVPFAGEEVDAQPHVLPSRWWACSGWASTSTTPAWPTSAWRTPASWAAPRAARCSASSCASTIPARR